MCGDADCGTGEDSEDDILTHMPKYHEGPLKIRKLCIDEKTGEPYYYKCVLSSIEKPVYQSIIQFPIDKSFFRLIIQFSGR